MRTVHPEAAKRAEELAVRALDSMASEPSARPNRGSSYAPDIAISGHIAEADIRGPVLGFKADRFGRETERSYADSSHYFVLGGPAHEDFRKAVRTLSQQRAIRAAASEDAIARLVFEWMCVTRINGPIKNLTDSVLANLESLIREIEVVIPLFGIHVQSPLTIGLVTLADVTDEELSSWREMSYRAAPDNKDVVDVVHSKLRKQLQGRAAARMKVIAEPDLAVKHATEQAELSVAILRVASIGAFAPEKPTLVALMGREVVARGMHIVLGPNDQFLPSEFTLNPEDRPWVLDDDTVQKQVRPLVDPWSVLLAKQDRTTLDETALRSVLLYSRATRYRNISEKLLHIFAAIESLLLRSESEPISVAVGDRLAFAVGRSADERMTIVKNFREVYSMRSKFVHHALEPAPDAPTLLLLEEFLKTVCAFFINLGSVVAKFQTKDAFLDALDRRKYA